MLFERVNAFRVAETRPRPEEVAWTGFNALVFKAPFADLGNWAPLGSWSFAVAMERHLLAHLERALREASVDRLGVAINRDASSVLKAFDVLKNELSQNGYTTTLFVLAGQLGTQLAVDLQQAIVGAWNDAVKSALGTTFRILGTHAGVPILDIPDSPAAGIYAVDLAQFGRLTRYGELPEFGIEEITPERAQSLLEHDPNLASDDSESGKLIGNDPLRRLQLKVLLKLFETYELKIVDREAAAGSPLTGPVLEWEPRDS